MSNETPKDKAIKAWIIAAKAAMTEAKQAGKHDKNAPAAKREVEAARRLRRYCN